MKNKKVTLSVVIGLASLLVMIFDFVFGRLDEMNATENEEGLKLSGEVVSESKLPEVLITGTGIDLKIKSDENAKSFYTKSYDKTNENVTLRIRPDVKVLIRVDGTGTDLFIQKELFDMIEIEDTGTGTEVHEL